VSKTVSASKRKTAKKKRGKKKVGKKTSKRKTARQKAGRKATKKKTGRKATKKKAAGKKTAKKKTTKKTAKKKTAKKTAKKRTAKRPTTKKKTRKAGGKKPIVPGPRQDQLAQTLQSLRLVSRLDDETPEAVPELLQRLEELADPTALPSLFGILEDDDRHGLGWGVFYVMERFDDAYLAALIDELPALWARAPGWAQTCIIRILNTRLEPDDCTHAFLRLCREASADRRQLLLEILEHMATTAGDELTPGQKESIEVAADAIRG